MAWWVPAIWLTANFLTVVWVVGRGSLPETKPMSAAVGFVLFTVLYAYGGFFGPLIEAMR